MRNSLLYRLGMLWWMTGLPSVKTLRSFLIKLSGPPAHQARPPDTWQCWSAEISDICCQEHSDTCCIPSEEGVGGFIFGSLSSIFIFNFSSQLQSDKSYIKSKSQLILFRANLFVWETPSFLPHPEFWKLWSSQESSQWERNYLNRRVKELGRLEVKNHFAE